MPEDSDDQTQRCAAATEEDIRIQHRFRPDMERFTGFQRRIDGAILLVNRDVFQRPGRHDAAIQRGQRQRTMNTKEPQQRYKMTYAHPTTLPSDASGVEIVSIII